MKQSETPSPKAEQDAAEYYAVYSEYAKVLRAWFVAYGVGGPVLFLTQERISNAIAKSGQGRWIVALFLIGVALQIVIAMLNKWSNWYLYAWADPSIRSHPGLYRCVDWFSEQFWVDILFDVGTVIAFGWATVRVFLLFV